MATMPIPMKQLHFIWLEITGKCQLQCEHCYADSGPKSAHGMMRIQDWTRIIDEAKDLGVRMVQFIGGEPTLHPGLPCLIDHVIGHRMAVEVFSNLVRVSRHLWDIFSLPGVRLATSYYADNAAQHERITQRKGSYESTKRNITEAVRRSIPLRVGVINVQDDQRVEQACTELRELGVTEIATDRLRQVGRGARDQLPGVSQLCGNCARGKVAVTFNGEVWPCVFARWISLGNVMSTPLPEIVTTPKMSEISKQLAVGATRRECFPEKCDPLCPPSCSPSCIPQNNCRPVGSCGPDW